MHAASPQACLDAFIAAMVGRNMPAALDQLTDDVVLFYSNGLAIWGKQQFSEVMTANWKLIENYEYKTIESLWVAQSDTVASVTYTLAWSGIANGNPVSGSGRGTRVLRRDPNDGWRIAHEHLSSGAWKS